MASYTINSIDEDGKSNVDVTIGDTTYNQDLILSLDPAEATATMDTYVKDYAQGLVPADKPTPNPVKSLIGVETEVVLSKAVTDQLAAAEAATLEAK
jgi:hypothetical protein